MTIGRGLPRTRVQRSSNPVTFLGLAMIGFGWGALRLGVYLDAGLIIGAIVLAMPALRPSEQGSIRVPA